MEIVRSNRHRSWPVLRSTVQATDEGAETRPGAPSVGNLTPRVRLGLVGPEGGF